MTPLADARVLQICHGYDGPFLDCARQYAVLFAGTPYKVTTVFLTGAPDPEVAAGCASDEVLFLDYSSRAIRGLKLRAIREIRQIARLRNVQLCIAHRFKPIYIACLATRLPVIGVHHAFGIYTRLMRRAFVGVFRRRLTLLGVSDAVRDDMRRCLSDWPAERIQTLYNRIDVAAVQACQVDRASARAELGLPDGAWIVGNVGRLHPDKDQATLLRGFAAALPGLPSNSLLVIIGTGRLEGELKALAHDLGIAPKVAFLGQVAEARRYFKAFDVFALSSDHEPFGMVLLEAMAADVPIICSDCGGGREVVSGVGMLFPLRDGDVLAKHLLSLARSDALQAAGRREAMAEWLDSCFSDKAAQGQFRELMPRMERLEASR
ncbi:glycosyltransferase [Pseudomonas sp.]|uniref:glycosyltransferase n=1 Tax=Pseudomonas sp. TaxID=306 RepID=UPI0028A5E519|nr:glycosyltransferase [Pseudomonas sp.]